MKRSNLKNILLIAALVLSASMMACSSSTPGQETETSIDSVGDVDTETTTEVSTNTTETLTETEFETEAETETTTETETDSTETETEVEITDGMMVYYEDFDSYDDIEELQSVVDALGWKIQTVAEDLAYKDWTAQMSIQNGRLYIHNYWTDQEAPDYVAGNDSYCLILSDEYMEAAKEYGYTFQYDVTYMETSNYKRYITILTEYGGDIYHSFHFRVGGYGDMQSHWCGQWPRSEVIDPTVDLCATLQKNSPEEGTTIAYKLLGIETEIADKTAIENFRNVTATIRIQVHPTEGYTVWMKTAQNEDFICVSKTSVESEGIYEWQDVQECCSAMCLKVGGKVNGYIDNIAVWTGFSDMPTDKTVTYVPTAQMTD